MSKRRQEPFAAVVARVTAQPARPRRVPTGRHGDTWGDRAGAAYSLVDAQLAPADALRLAAAGAQIVYDACGCGGDQCALDWLTVTEVRDLAAGRELPVRRPSGTGRAELGHWRSAASQDLVVAAVEVSWGRRIPG